MHEAGLARARQVVELLRQRLGDGGWALYGMGSLGYGNYVPGWSDLDLDVILPDGPADYDEAELTEYASRAGYPDVDVKTFTLSELLHPDEELLYGVANRLVMLIDSARHLYGPDIRPQLARPGRDTLRAESARVAAALAGMSDEWWATRPLDDLAALLALPARLLYTAGTGRVTDKQTALEYLLSSGDAPPAELWPWLGWALACRMSAAIRRLPESAVPLGQAAARRGLSWAEGRLR
jgi:hypothetical protein